ncbi:class I SAM-dependent methyltransferase [Puniceibacterium sp. IMCC21224]|uniref:class I SAM-dependent methyltransferase n=1 Tax=Puniceibacterium sp. IMCC21224 TaxID=1618204 RepID=UPI00064DB7EF|nr:methyltransferase [Puniceibacterium sp. IMCC21224]KMK66757.1 16S rRNA m(2)G 1207 methyltransferase [Puniceibacterium sp. IMCC21224]
MASSRLNTALGPDGLILPATGKIALFEPPADTDLSDLPLDRCQVIQSFRSDADALAARGFDCVTAPDGLYAAAIVFLPRVRELSQAQIAAACAAAPDGPVLVDGQKTDGVDSMLRHIRARVPVDGHISKAHGKAFWFASSPAFADWTSAGITTNAAGYLTAPGVFSADDIDPASALLAATLPARLGSGVADLGAGWGYLSAQILSRPEVTTLHVVEADHTALTCARANVTDPRAHFYWEDATRWLSRELVDSVVMNPPFHVSRKADPGLGQAFIAAAARAMKPSGSLWMVANRHLPYESALSSIFAQVTEVGGDSRFKILHAQRPARTRR